MRYQGLGLGCMSMHQATQEENERVISTSLDKGITYLNIGDFYSSGQSEMVLGNALKNRPREDFFISVKFGGLMEPRGAMYGMDVDPYRIKNYLAYTLSRLKLDYIDLYQPSRIDTGIPVEETIGAISDLVKEGYVRHIGVSMVDAETLERAHAVHPIEFVEMEYSLFNRSIETSVLPAARKLGIGVVAFGILAHGVLSGYWTRERVASGEHPFGMPIGLLEPQNFEKNIELIENLDTIASEKNVSVPQLAYAWALSKGDDIVPLIGTGKVSHFNDLLRARDITLSETDIQRIEAAIPLNRIAGTSMSDVKFKNGFINL